MSCHLAAWGRLGENPREIETRGEQRTAVTSLAVAVAEHGVDDPPLWFGLVAFGRQAEALLRHHKGDLLSISGRLQRRRWKGPDGTAHERLQVVVADVVSARTARPSGGRPRQRHDRAAAAVRAQAPASRLREEIEAGLDDEIPF